MKKLIMGIFVVVGIINLLPITGVLGAERLSILYGLSFEESNISILMRHRAVLFGMLGALLIYAAFKPLFQPVAFIAGFTAMLSFLVLTWSTGNYNEAIERVVIADVVGALCLTVGLVLYFVQHRNRT